MISGALDMSEAAVMAVEGDVEIVCVAPHAVGYRSDIVRCLGPAVEYAIGAETLPYLIRLCSSGRAMLWAISISGAGIVAMMVTDDILYERGLAIRVRLLGGREAHRWLGPLQDALGEWARQAGAIHVEITGRRGWERFCRRYGRYKPQKVAIQMAFDVPGVRL